MNERSAENSTVIARLFALQRVRPFHLLSADELTLLAEVARPREHAPGELVTAGGLALSHLLVVVDGQIVAEDGKAAGPVIGVASLLRDRPVPRLEASPALGAKTLQIGKRHFFTLARECPEFILGLLELGEAGARAEGP